jgi:hypothetical protein
MTSIVLILYFMLIFSFPLWCPKRTKPSEIKRGIERQKEYYRALMEIEELERLMGGRR